MKKPLLEIFEGFLESEFLSWKAQSKKLTDPWVSDRPIVFDNALIK